MYKFETEYTNYFGETRKKTVYFQLSRPEVLGFATTLPGGVTAGAQKLVESHDEFALFNNFEKMIALSYGEISQDGDRFVKSPELSKAFMETPVYQILFDKMITDKDFLTAFIEGVVPEDNKEEVANALVDYINGKA